MPHHATTSERPDPLSDGEPSVRIDHGSARSSLIAGVTAPDVEGALTLCATLTAVVPLPGRGRTMARWELLAELAARDLTTARIVEAHLDAIAILAEAEADEVSTVPPHPSSTWGVFAAEGPKAKLLATRAADGGWQLSGEKPWCSLAGHLTHALVTAHLLDAPEGPGGRGLFAVRLNDPGVMVRTGRWHARGLAAVPSGPVAFESVPAAAVGHPGWYLSRSGFDHGGIGVAACWYGGAVGLARALIRAAEHRRPDELALWHIGETDLLLHTARTTLHDAAARVDSGAAHGIDGRLLSLRTRSVVAAAAESVLTRVGHALGPAPLALDDDHARRVADLTVYLRQHHAERDAAVLGRSLLESDTPW